MLRIPSRRIRLDGVVSIDHRDTARRHQSYEDSAARQFMPAPFDIVRWETHEQRDQVDIEILLEGAVELLATMLE